MILARLGATRLAQPHALGDAARSRVLLLGEDNPISDERARTLLRAVAPGAVP